MYHTMCFQYNVKPNASILFNFLFLFKAIVQLLSLMSFQTSMTLQKKIDSGTGL